MVARDRTPTTASARSTGRGRRPGRRPSRASTVRVRVINTDNGPVQVWAERAVPGARVDGTDVNEPTAVDGRGASPSRPAAGSTSSVTVPEDGSGVRVQVGAATAVVVGPDGVEVARRRRSPSRRARPARPTASPAPLGFDPANADRRFDYAIGRRPGFVRRQARAVVDDQRPPVPGRADVRGRRGRRRADADRQPQRRRAPDAPARPPRRRALPRRRSRPPAARGGSTRSNVKDGETYEIAFVADNPGIWMDHCHNLNARREGLVAHLMYAGVTEPYRVGGRRGQRAGVATRNTTPPRVDRIVES